MNKRKINHCNIISTATALPKNLVTTYDMLEVLADKMSDELYKSIIGLCINQRYSIMEKFPHYLGGDDRKLISDTSQLGYEAVKKCIETSGIDSSQISLFIGITNTSNRPLPCFSYEVMTKAKKYIPTNVNVINMQDQGCSVFLKAIEIAQNFLNVESDKYAVIVMSEAHTGYHRQFKENKYFSLKEASQLNQMQLANSMFFLEAFLFGDGAVAFLIGKDPHFSSFGLTTHSTNELDEDLELIHMDEGGLLKPTYSGYPNYILSKSVPERGALYAKNTIESLIKNEKQPLRHTNQADYYFIHTGSKKILDGVCKCLNLPDASEKTSYAYKILRDYGNLSSASIGFMLNNCLKDKKKGKGIMTSFGVGFSSSSGFVELT